MKFKTIAYWIFRASTPLISLFLILWIFPLFLLPENIGIAYIDWLLGMQGSNDPSRFAAIPFVYFFISLPAGVILLLITEILWRVTPLLLTKPLK